MPSSSSEAYTVEPLIVNLTWLGSCIVLTHYFILMAYNIRLIAIREFGTVIHEFDPYFNYRATEYLYNNGIKKFFTWYDYKSWYPLGRPIGTTIYPGMQFTATFIKKYIVKDSMSLNDVCCYVPAWFGVFASMLVGLITYECTLQCNTKQTFFGVMKKLIKFPKWRYNSSTGSKIKRKLDPKKIGKHQPLVDNSDVLSSHGLKRNKRIDQSNDFDPDENDDYSEEDNLFLNMASPATECGIIAMGIMGMVPAHLTRSVGGGFDNESVAMSAMCLTFYFWVRSLRADDDNSHMYGIATGVAYFYMVATWGGHVFVLNMIGLHAVVLVLLGRFSTKIYMSFSGFYIVGTLLAMQVPVVGMTPIKSLEQIPTLLVFVTYQILQFCEVSIRTKRLKQGDAWRYRIKVYGSAITFIMISFVMILRTGYFGPISSRIRGLFVKQTKTGNPLVDSVAEHQPADPRSYFRYLQHLCTFAPIGFIFTLVNFGDASSFVIVYALAAYYFSLKMVRLILLIGPVASILGGIAFGRTLTWSFLQLWIDDEPTSNNSGNGSKSNQILKRKKNFGKKGNSDTPITREITNKNRAKDGTLLKRLLATILVFMLSLFAASFQNYSLKMSRALSNPSIMALGQRSDGFVVKLDDYRESYWWLRDNTPEDSRILAWWDYGYQITALANRTTIADGNTWNHEHIALLGKILTTNEDEGYNIARHLADYVLIWAGGGGDDLAKSPHLARIANSVYRGQCPKDPTWSEFGFVDRRGTPSPMMRESFLYKLHSHGIVEGVTVDPKKFEEVYRSKFGKVRIYRILNVDKDSKSWVADPRNRLCDKPGSWFCRGQYPPSLNDVLMNKKDFSQLEDFNKKQTDPEYQDQYFHNLNNRRNHRSNKNSSKRSTKGQEEPIHSNRNFKTHLNLAQIDAVNARWEDTEETTELWRIITSGEVSDLERVIHSNPILGHIRSSDGRGPMWWAFEHRKQEMVKILMQNGVSHSERDKDGLTPVDLLDEVSYNIQSKRENNNLT